MAFGSCIFIVVIIFSHIGTQTIQSTTTEQTDGTNLVTFSTSQIEDDSSSVSASTTEEFTDDSHSVYENKYSTSVATDIPTTRDNATISSTEDMEITVETVSLLSSAIPEEPTKAVSSSSETRFTYISEKLETSANDTHSFDGSISSTQTQMTDVDESIKESEIVITEDTNITTSSVLWNIRNGTSRESRMFTTDATYKHEYQLIILRSNCSIVNSENISLSDDLSDVGCTIHLRLNLSSENATRDKLLSTLKKLNIKPSEYHMVETYEVDASGHKQQDKHRGFVFDPETFAYLAVAIAFAFLLLLAVMVFGFRCFRKRRPSLDISRFDVRLSNYTLTKIPRASLSATDSLHESDCMDDKPELSTVRSNNGGSCESDLDIIPCDTYSSNREMKTFGVSRSSVSGNSNSPSDMYPQHNPVAYENHTFQRYF